MPGDQSSYLGMVRRVIRAAGRRVGSADVEDLPELVVLRGEVETAIAAAVDGLRASGRSWADIAKGLGTSREAAWQRYAQPREDQS